LKPQTRIKFDENANKSVPRSFKQLLVVFGKVTGKGSPLGLARNRRDATAMFLIRSAFVLAVVIMLLPTDEAQQAKVAGTAGLAVERAATFCERNAATCAAGAEVWSVFLKKAEFGARLAGNMVQDYLKGGKGEAAGRDSDRAQSLDPSHRPQVAPARLPEPVRGTLAPGDLAPAWRGNTTRTRT
jgi:Family of unknown function (DUF5330)